MVNPARDILTGLVVGLVAAGAWNAYKKEQLRKTDAYYKQYDQDQAKIVIRTTRKKNKHATSDEMGRQPMINWLKTVRKEIWEGAVCHSFHGYFMVHHELDLWRHEQYGLLFREQIGGEEPLADSVAQFFMADAKTSDMEWMTTTRLCRPESNAERKFAFFYSQN